MCFRQHILLKKFPTHIEIYKKIAYNLWRFNGRAHFKAKLLRCDNYICIDRTTMNNKNDCFFSHFFSFKLNGEKSYWNAHANNRGLKRLRNTYSPAQQTKMG